MESTNPPTNEPKFLKPPVVYTAAPYRGDTVFDVLKNITVAYELSCKLWEAGCVVISPHMNTFLMSELPVISDPMSASTHDPIHPHYFLNGDLRLVELSDVVLVGLNWDQSEGTMTEMVHAYENNIPVFDSIDVLLPWLESYPGFRLQKPFDPVVKRGPAISPRDTIIHSPAPTGSIADSMEKVAKAACEPSYESHDLSDYTIGDPMFGPMGNRRARGDKRMGDFWHIQEPSSDDGGEIETNEVGGKQSKLDTRCDLLDGRAMLVLARVLKEGADKYEPDNWRKISEQSHINHALTHLFNYLIGDPDTTDQAMEDELAHAFCRLMMAVAVRERSY